MTVQTILQTMLDLAEQGLTINPGDGHSERLAQLIQSLEAIKAQAIAQIEAPTGKA